MTHKIIIDNRGYVRCLYNPDLPIQELGIVKLRRLSHIRPAFAPIKGLLFRILRWLLGERGRIAAWTRTWSGPWKVKVIACGEWSTFMYRWEAVRWELKHMEECEVCKHSIAGKPWDVVNTETPPWNWPVAGTREDIEAWCKRHPDHPHCKWRKANPKHIVI